MPDTFINQDTTAIEVIYFLGGSTMYGVNVTDRETIASAFVNAYQQQFPRGVSIKVVNYGIPAYHSYNELMLLSHLVYSGRSPGVVIMLDGLNDFLMPVAAKERLPYYYYRLKLASKDKISFKELAQIADSTETLYTSPAGYTAKALTDSLVKNYLSNLNQVNKLSVSNGFKAFCFIQPNPFYNYPNKKHDPVCDQLEYPLVTSGYALLASRSSSVENCFFLGNMLANEKGFPFIDRFHYSPEMCKRIAAELVGVVGERINKP
ncbi:MAG: SGNH/GDSL hydrolase family protein [Chitinophagaceae bacterium]